jgi:hypothetical protein
MVATCGAVWLAESDEDKDDSTLCTSPQEHRYGCLGAVNGRKIRMNKKEEKKQL